ncbi:ribonuclease E/G [Pseudoalteromonas luteoviolacea]|uniref:ribonuclease E/G n=1 Tax=Pseudoalteromonas luteoviolacea TaxID=43657 RepID=UPI001B37C147|nr:ribonuclease E/G [Pseudoalteromonas luteoviolacea]MBQ4810913.1 ribonuclease E/G [Pseudoalteromonas luteoviolacea]
MKRLLISAQQKDTSLRMGVLEGALYRPVHLDIDRKLDIYNGKITSMSAECMMADIGGGTSHKLISREPLNHREIKVGDLLLVQVIEDDKDLVLSSTIRLVGEYLTITLSKNEKVELRKSNLAKLAQNIKASGKQALDSYTKIELNNGCELVNEECIEFELRALLLHWETILEASIKFKKPLFIHQHTQPMNTLLEQAISQGVTEIFTDSQDMHQSLTNYLSVKYPSSKIYFYDDQLDIIDRYREIDWEHAKVKKGVSGFLSRLFKK